MGGDLLHTNLGVEEFLKNNFLEVNDYPVQVAFVFTSIVLLENTVILNIKSKQFHNQVLFICKNDLNNSSKTLVFFLREDIFYPTSWP